MSPRMQVIHLFLKSIVQPLQTPYTSFIVVKSLIALTSSYFSLVNACLSTNHDLEASFCVKETLAWEVNALNSLLCSLCSRGSLDQHFVASFQIGPEVDHIPFAFLEGLEVGQEICFYCVSVMGHPGDLYYACNRNSRSESTTLEGTQIDN